MESLLKISHEIAEIEVMLTKLNQMEIGLPQPRRAASMQRELRLHSARIQSLRANLRGRERDIRAMLEALISRGSAPRELNILFDIDGLPVIFFSSRISAPIALLRWTAARRKKGSTRTIRMSRWSS